MSELSSEYHSEATEATSQAEVEGLRHCSKLAEDTKAVVCTPRTVITRHEDGTLRGGSSFQITSGVILWGQILTMNYGVSQPGLTSNAEQTPRDASEYGGTVRMHLHTYKSAARIGAWKVRRYYSGLHCGFYGDARTPVGWVMCHESVNPMEIIMRVRAIGGGGPGAISNGNGHVDKDVLFIGRYDWAWYPNSPEYQRSKALFREWAAPAIGTLAEGTDTHWRGDGGLNVEQSGYFMAVDRGAWGLDLVRAYKDECEAPLPAGERQRERIFETLLEGKKVGAYVSSASTEYEFGTCSSCISTLWFAIYS